MGDCRIQKVRLLSNQLDDQMAAFLLKGLA